jgi:DNA-binding response OmpR family regulator
MDRRFCILLIDSDSAGRGETTRMLRAAGYIVEPVRDPLEASLDRAVDFVLLVLRPPMGRLLSFYSLLRRESPSLPVLVIGPVTARASISPSNYLVTPYTTHALLERIASLLEEPKADDEALMERLQARGLSSIDIRELLESDMEGMTLAERIERLFDRTEESAESGC